jgi:hypothetical protein
MPIDREDLPLVDRMPDRCLICERLRALSSEFCSVHDAALRNLEAVYPTWNKGYDGKLSREEYFAKVATLPETGRSVKQVIQHIFAKREQYPSGHHSHHN